MEIFLNEKISKRKKSIFLFDLKSDILKFVDPLFTELVRFTSKISFTIIWNNFDVCEFYCIMHIEYHILLPLSNSSCMQTIWLKYANNMM